MASLSCTFGMRMALPVSYKSILTSALLHPHPAFVPLQRQRLPSYSARYCSSVSVINRFYHYFSITFHFIIIWHWTDLCRLSERVCLLLPFHLHLPITYPILSYPILSFLFIRQRLYNTKSKPKIQNLSQTPLISTLHSPLSRNPYLVDPYYPYPFFGFAILFKTSPLLFFYYFGVVRDI